MADKFEDLRTFVAIVNSGGVNSAAAELGIAKSAVSRRLSDLEKRLGVPLIDRTSRRVTATPLGLSYFDQACEILAALDRLDAGIHSPGQSEPVTISASSSILAHVLIPALARLRDAGTMVAVRFVADEASAAVVIAADYDPHGGRKTIALGETTEVMCASTGYLRLHPAPTKFSDLREHDYVSLARMDAVADRASASPVTMRSVLAVPDIETAYAACLAGFGIAQLPSYVAGGAIGDGRLVRVLHSWASPPSRLSAFVRPGAGADARRLVDALAISVGET